MPVWSRNVMPSPAMIFPMQLNFNLGNCFFQASSSVRGAILLPHLGVAALIEHDLGKFRMRGHLALGAPAIEIVQEIAQAPARLRFQLVGLDHGAGGLEQRNAPLAGVVVQHLHGGVAKGTRRTTGVSPQAITTSSPAQAFLMSRERSVLAAWIVVRIASR